MTSLFSEKSFANWDWGLAAGSDGGSAPSGACNPDYSKCVHTSLGTTWRAYNIDDTTPNTLEIPTSNGIGGGIIDIEKCRNLGADQYYRLALERFNVRFVDGEARAESSVIQVGLWPVGKVSGMQGSGLHPNGGVPAEYAVTSFNGQQVKPTYVTAILPNGGEYATWNTAYEFFKVAAQEVIEYKPEDWGNLNNKGISWFCWNSNWSKDDNDKKMGKFYAQSSVSIPLDVVPGEDFVHNDPNKLDLYAKTYTEFNASAGGMEISGMSRTWISDYDGPALAKFTTTEDSFMPLFKHQLFYENRSPMTIAAGTDKTIGTHYRIYYYEKNYSTEWASVDPDTPGVSDAGGGNFSDLPAGEIFAKSGYYTPKGIGLTVDLSGLAIGQSKVVCSIIRYFPKYINFVGTEISPGTFIYRLSEEQDSTSEVSKACIVVTKGEIKVESGSGTGEFSSKSFYQVDHQSYEGGGGDVKEASGSSSIDSVGPVELDGDVLSVSWDGQTIKVVDPKVKFYHQLQYVFHGVNTIVGVDQNIEDHSQDTYTGSATTEWNTYTTQRGVVYNPDTGEALRYMDLGPTAQESNKTYSVTPPNENKDFITVTVIDEVAASGMENQEKRVICSTIQYEPKYITFKLSDTDGDVDVKSYDDWVNYGKNSTSSVKFYNKEDFNEEYTKYTKGETSILSHKILHVKYNFEVDTENTEKNGGSGASRVCYQFYRDIIVDNDKYHPLIGGESQNTALFVGETSKAQWSGEVRSTLDYRVKQFQAYAYLVPANVEFRKDKLESYNKEGWISSSSRGSTGRVCDYIQNNFANAKCIVITEEAEIYNPTDADITYWANYDSGDIDIALPNDVGWKYCVTNAFYTEEWEFYTPPEEDAEPYWRKKPSGDHGWAIYNSRCKTLKKKPTIAIWNGGFMTQGGVDTITALRFNDSQDELFAKRNGNKTNQSEDTKYDDNERTNYGSWAEDLAVVGGEVSGFGSGSTLSRGTNIRSLGSDGLTSTKTNLYQISPLTISNTEQSNIGQSKVTTNTALKLRILQYLRDRKLDNTLFIEKPCGIVENGKVKIVKVDTVDKITLTGCQGGVVGTSSSEPYDNIYQIPQTIIFANNVDIKGDITEVNAWIIATGTINTCLDFASKTTSTTALRANGLQYGDEVTTDTVCDQPLKFNGPVIANDIILNRTYGADPKVYSDKSKRYTPAEIFNLSAANYLWAYAQASRYSSSYTEGYSRELPPRY